MNYKEITDSVLNKDIYPIYFLMGDETFYIDKIIDLFVNNILTNKEKEFNEIIMYGKDVSVDQIISEAKQFPLNSTKRLIIIKEAQQIKNIEKLLPYIEKPQNSTILVLAYKGKTIDKRKKIGKVINTKCIVFNSKKLYDNQLSNWITSYVKDYGYTINHNATAILAEHIGNDLTKLSNEIDKLMLIINKKDPITSTSIENHVGISKEYNIFELQNSLGNKDILKANLIINYFSKNTKNYNIIIIISSLFSFFQKILIYHSLSQKDSQSITSALKINPFFINQYQEAAKKYSKKQLFYIFQYLKEYDLKSKGLNNKSTNQNGLLKELIFKILHA